jgi:hypothetical protein
MLTKNCILVSKAKSDISCMAEFKDKNKKENIVESSKPKYTQVSKTLFIILMLTKAKIDIACIAGFNDKNNKENIVESSKPEYTQVSKILLIMLTKNSILV